MMGTLGVFNFVSLDGYLHGPTGDLSWAKQDPQESDDYAADRMKGGSVLLFGRKTYQLMASYWPSPDAIKRAPAVAEGMNKAQKIVFSRTLSTADWNNTRVAADARKEVERLKKSGTAMTILGSGSVVTQLAEAGLIDEYQIAVHPVVLGAGTAMFKGIGHQLHLALASSRSFKNGIVILTYRP
jgi:dihydrofolate reductase